MSSKQTSKTLVGKNTCRTLKLPPVAKTSKPKTKLPLTKKTNEIPETGNTDKLSLKRKRPKAKDFRRKMNGTKETEIPAYFVVRFSDKLASLKDPDVVKVMDLLSKANDVKVHRKFFVSCSSKNAASELQAELQKFDSSHKKFRIFSDNRPFTPRTPESKSHMLYAIGLPRNTADKDLHNCFSKAKSVHITQFQKGKKCVRIGHINFTNAQDAKEALAVKNCRVNGSYVQVTTDRSAAVKRLKEQNVSSLAAKRAKLDMDKKTQDEAEAVDANDEDDSEDEESCSSEIGVEEGDDKNEDGLGSTDDEEEEDDDDDEEDDDDDDEEVGGDSSEDEEAGSTDDEEDDPDD